MKARLEWKPQDLWVGVYWKRLPYSLDLWVCLVPMLPIHLRWSPYWDEVDAKDAQNFWHINGYAPPSRWWTLVRG